MVQEYHSPFASGRAAAVGWAEFGRAPTGGDTHPLRLQRRVRTECVSPDEKGVGGRWFQAALSQ